MIDRNRKFDCFFNPSKRIKIMAHIMLIINAITTLVFAIVFGREDLRPDYDFHFGYFLLILIIGLLVGYVIPLLVYGFGQLIDNTDVNQLTNNDIRKEEKIKTSNSGFDNLLSSTQNENKSDEPKNESSSVNEWKCPKCRAVNQNYIGTCGCGEIKPH